MTTTAVSVGRVGAFRARMAGANARRDGLPVTACPDLIRGEWAERTRARYWVLGWYRADKALRSQ